MMVTQTARFWMVARANGPKVFNYTPKVRHATRADAYAEAERLAKKESVPFIVLEAIDEVIPSPQPPKIELREVEVPQPAVVEWRRTRYRDLSDPDQIDTSGRRRQFEGVLTTSDIPF